MEKEVLAFKQTIKNFYEFSVLDGYKAVRYNDISVCNNANQPDTCKNIAKDIFNIKALAEGKCGNIEQGIVIDNSGLRLVDLCEHVKNGSCNLLFGSQKKKCDSFYLADPRIFKELSDSSFEVQTKEQAIRIFSVFLGFKNQGGIKRCKEMGSLFQGTNKFICEIVFGTEDIERMLDRIAQDIALFYITRKYNLNLCNEIKDKKIRGDCFDPRIMNLDW